MYKKLLASLLSVSLVISLFCGCAKTEVAQTNTQTETKTEVQTEAQNEIKFINGMLSYASITEEERNDAFKRIGVSAKYYDNLSSIMLALRAGQVDYISPLPKSTAQYIKERNNDIEIRKTDMSKSDKLKYHMAVLEKNRELYNMLNDTLKDMIDDGTIKNIEAKYIDGFVNDKEDPKVVDMPHFNDAKTIKVAVTGDLPPFDFVSADGIPAGYNAALLFEIANRAKVNIELVPMDEKAKVTALATGNIDAIFWLSSTKLDNREDARYDCPKEVIMTESYYEDDAYLVYIKGKNLGTIND